MSLSKSKMIVTRLFLKLFLYEYVSLFLLLFFLITIHLKTNKGLNKTGNRLQ